MDEQYKKISVTELAIFIRISWLTVSFFAIIKFFRELALETIENKGIQALYYYQKVTD